MEKPVSPMKITIFKYLPNPRPFLITKPPPFDNWAKPKTPQKRASSSPIVSMIPLEARSKKKSISFESQSQEPTSPKVSCMGQIKHRKKDGKKRRSSSAMRNEAKALLNIMKMLQNKVRTGLVLDEEVEEVRPVAQAQAPPIGEMRRLTSGRNTLMGFDWTAAVSGLATLTEGHLDCHVDVKGEKEDMVMRHSASVLVVDRAVGMETRTEINLWKRRALAPLVPLQFSSKKD